MAKNNLNSVSLWLILISLAVFLFACDGSGHLRDLEDYVISLKQKVLTKKEPIKTARIASPKPVTYKPQSTRTPFQDQVSKAGKNVKATAPLNAYPLNVLRLIGTWRQQDQIRAIIMTPDNKVYEVSQGDLIGDQYGKIKTIMTDHIEVVETITDSGHGATQRIIQLRLKDQN